MPAFGLDIGSSSIKLIELTGKADKPVLKMFGLAVNPVGNIETENENERVQIAQAVRKLVNDAGVKQGKVVAALPESKVFTRVIDMPKLSESELASAINWEAEQYIPIPVADVKLDYRVLDQDGASEEGKGMRVLLVAAPLTVVNRTVALLELAGLEPLTLETEVLSLARSLVGTDITMPVLLVHLGAKTTDMCIVEKNEVAFTRSVLTGGNALSRAVANDLNLQITQAEQYKRTYGLDAAQLQGKVRGVLVPVFRSLVGEVRKAMYFYTTSRKGKVGRIILSGGGAYLPQITAELAREVGVEVILGDPFGKVVMSERQKKRIGGIGSVFSVAVGLAMRAL